MRVIALYFVVLALLIVPKATQAQAQDSTIKEIIVAFLYCEEFEKFTAIPHLGKNFKLYVDNGANYRKIALSIKDTNIKVMHAGRAFVNGKDDWIVVNSISVKRNKATIKATHWKFLDGEFNPLKKGEIYMKRKKGKWKVTGTDLL